jgi:hypothetical protein
MWCVVMAAGGARSAERSTDAPTPAHVRALQRVRADMLGMQPWQTNEIAGLLFAVRCHSGSSAVLAACRLDLSGRMCRGCGCA